MLSATGAISPLPAALRKAVVAAIEALGLAGIQTAGSRLLELLKASDAEAWDSFTVLHPIFDTKKL